MAALRANQTKTGETPTAILVAHNGALGDFLCCWPGILAIASHFNRQSQSCPPLYFLGREFMHPWVLPLGYARCPPNLSKAAEELYATDALPAPLAGSKIFWFCLDKPPHFPCLYPTPPSEITPLPILDPEQPQDFKTTSSKKTTHSHVRGNLKAQLETLGITWPLDWREAWQSLFGGWQGQNSKEIALLPGSGHRNKEWPLPNFIALADKLAEQGWEPLFIIGEIERERGLLPPAGHNWEDPSPPAALAERLRSVRAIVSNDAGPAHLAGMYAVPGVILFGPTPPKVWGVPGMANITRLGLCAPDQPEGMQDHEKSLKLNFNFTFKTTIPVPLLCSPCSVNLRNITCSTPVCMESLSPEMVWAALTGLLRETA